MINYLRKIKMVKHYDNFVSLEQIGVSNFYIQKRIIKIIYVEDLQENKNFIMKNILENKEKK